MHRPWRKLELVCVICSEPLADVEAACAGLVQISRLKSRHNDKLDDHDPLDISLSPILSQISTYHGGFSGRSHLSRYPLPQYGGYMPLTEANPKQVVATKCGHMYHQGCLRQHIQKSLMAGKGGSLFCPICTRPFAMNRVWPVFIPPTKHQRDRFVQLALVKERNAEMVEQLKEIRAKIEEEEEKLRKIKIDSDQCVQDIRQKQRMLECVNGPANEEIQEMTKIHLKRQEILRVVTKHNADLLKLLAEESNQNEDYVETITGQVAENYRKAAEQNAPETRSDSRAKSVSARTRSISIKRGRYNRRMKHERRRSQNNNELHDQSLDQSRLDKEREIQFVSTHYPSELIPTGTDTPNPVRLKDIERGLAIKKIDTNQKWKVESLKDLLKLPGLSASNASSMDHRRDNSSRKDKLSQNRR